VVHSTLECKFWMARMPSPEEVRPACCPVCMAASRESGRLLSVIGHGVRDRQLRGPAGPDAAPTVEVVLVRRYRCLRCRALITVVPREVEPRRHYTRPAIALALALWGLVGASAAAVREAISPWRVAMTTGWPTLRRWCRAVERRLLFAAGSPASTATSQEIAARVAQVALAHAPPTMRGEPERVQVFLGAVAMA
jgi:hypothetical protein